MKLVVVESPIKANTFQGYLDDEMPSTFKVIASGGHIKDLPVKTLGIKLDSGKFTGDYSMLKGKSEFIKQVKSFVKENSEIFICTDDDREGERIAEDIVNECNADKYYRYAPRELTKSAISEAIIKKVGIREIDQKVVAGQMVRREADRILGYGLSPAISWAAKGKDIKIRGTGRVEAIALDIIYDRHIKIENYKVSMPQPTDIIKATYKLNGIPFELAGEKLEYSKQETEELENSKHIARNNPHVINLAESDIVDKEPPPPLITSSLYATVSYLFGIEPAETKKLAQELFYHGIINYPRTDSYMLSDDAHKQIVTYLIDTIDIEDHDDIRRDKRPYKNKKGAQAAHEAIRPMVIDKEHSPEEIHNVWERNSKMKNLGVEHLKVYEIIWIYAISTQLATSRYKQTEVVIKSGPLTFKGKSHEPLNKGWEKYYGLQINESSKGMTDSWREKEVIFPEDLHVGRVFDTPIIDSYERPSRSPKRISAGMLISMLETLQVARPSTMHTISAKLVKKGYVSSSATLFSMNPSGVFVSKFNREYANELIDRKQATEFEATIVKIESGVITNTNEILQGYWDFVEEVKKRVDFVEFDKRAPTEAQIKKAKSYYDKLSKQEQGEISATTFETFKEISTFIDKYSKIEKVKSLSESIGVCPKCKKKSIINREKTFSCLTDKCEFVIFKSNIEKFLLSMKKDVTGYKLVNLITVLLEEKVVFITELNTQYGSQDTYFELKYSKKFKNYSLSFLSKESIPREEDKVGLWEHLSETITDNSDELEEAQEENRRLKDEARKDSLTRAFNRNALEQDVEMLIKNVNSKKIDNKISLVFFDGDKFKDINDTYGHGVGDEALQFIVNTCFSAIKHYKAKANVYRYGGDEFVLLYYSHEQDEVLKITNMLRRAIASKVVKRVGETEVKITVSMGISHWNNDSSSSLKEKADKALYRVKQNKGNDINTYE